MFEARGTLLLLVTAALSFSAGGVFMKYSEGLTRWAPATLVFACFIVGAALQAVAMRSAPMGVSYILVLGLESVATFALSILIFHEVPAPMTIAGVGVVIVGMSLLRANG